MKIKVKHILAAAIPFWSVQLIVLMAGYTDSRVVQQIYLPIFAVCALGLLFGRVWMGHGLWISASAGLLTEWIMGLTGAGGRTNTGGIMAGTAILLGGIAVSVLLQLVVDFRKKRAAGAAI